MKFFKWFNNTRFIWLGINTHVNKFPYGVDDFFFCRKSVAYISMVMIIFPCFFQFPLVACGQDGHNIVDSVSVPIEDVAGDIANPIITVQGSNLRLKNQLVPVDSLTENGSFVAPIRETIVRNNTKQSGGDGKQADDYYWVCHVIIWGSFCFMYFQYNFIYQR